MNEMPSCYRETRRKARKFHKCCECGRAINIQEKYIYISGVWNGDPLSFKHCDECHELFVLANSQSYSDEGPPLGGLWEWIRDGSNEAAEALGLNVNDMEAING